MVTPTEPVPVSVPCFDTHAALAGDSEPFTATEVGGDAQVPILREYLRRWKWEVGAFFQGVGADSPDDELRRIAPDHPVFRIGAPASTSKTG